MKGASQADLDWWLDLAPTLQWTFASTMPGVPHWYVVRGRTPGLSPEDFERAVRVTRTFGEPGKFYARTNLYLFTRDRRLWFWTMGAPIEETTIINVATTHKVYGEQANFDEDVLGRLRMQPE
ncbi:hypothetical protein SAMN04489867_0415 [Pedococcus dokdonensis]|uniref:Uncharacterized protein n=1 Tax=Pedococcus dokdonensis TaxID=443156 RepID=A0A1H0LW01_9MICO|nr:hypothetical protein [Pedococcus dokdonensis]SDO72304.1 hypothetical protein SAMN04489867_0415 [Pedococcus dokdonensis]